MKIAVRLVSDRGLWLGTKIHIRLFIKTLHGPRETGTVSVISGAFRLAKCVHLRGFKFFYMSSRIDLSNLNAPFFDRKKVKNGYGKRYTDRVIRVR